MNNNNTAKPKILIVEDDLTSQELYKLLLGKKYDLSICNEGKEVFAFVERTKADVVLMDNSLNGEKNGIGLIQYLRNNSIEHKHTPIVCYSAHVFSQDKMNALHAGADIFLAKPVSNEVLINTIETVLQNGEQN